MNEKDFLFKLGLILTPAFFTNASVEESSLLAVSFVILLVAVHGITLLFEKVLPSFQVALKAGHFREELLVFLTLVGLITFADSLAKSYGGVPARVFFPVVLVNAMLLLRRDSFKVKAKIALWFVFAVLILSVFKKAASQPILWNPFVGFLVLGFFLALVGFFLRRKWWIL